jgi:hypothetical protein
MEGRMRAIWFARILIAHPIIATGAVAVRDAQVNEILRALAATNSAGPLCWAVSD